MRINEASYVVRRGGKSSDVPENRLLKLFLARVLEVIDRTISLTGTGAIIKILTEIRNEAITALKHPYIKEIPQTLEANYLMRKRAYRHKNHIYRELYELYVQMQQALFRSKWSNIIDLLKNGWLAPINDDDLFELYTLVVILDLIEKDLSLGEPYDYGLIRSGRREIARFKSKDEKIECDIYFDQSPTKILPFLSEYKKIVSDYNGITGIEHRPDIIMRTKNNGVERYLIIEVKKTVDERYKRDSIYKMLGYLHDFGYLWKEQQDQYPKAVLVFPTGISLRTSTPPPNRNMVIISIEDKARFLSVIKSALSC